MKQWRYRVEAALLWCALQIFKMLGPDRASALGGWIGRTIGPRLSTSDVARQNILRAFPHMDVAQQNKTIVGMWDNLGRIMGEYPHLETIIHHHIEVVGIEHLKALSYDRPIIMMGTHLANWELGPFFFNHRTDRPMVGVYREPNNPYVAKMLDKCRNGDLRSDYVPKSQRGTRKLFKGLKDNRSLGLLIDQKYNEGMAVPFFGHPAMTGAAYVQFSRKGNAPIIPLQVERLEGCRFRITLYPSFEPGDMDDYDVVVKSHDMIEDWIRQRPEQWLWIHRRWDSNAFNRKQKLHNA